MSRSLKIFVDAHCFDKEYQGSRTFIKGIYTALSRHKGIEIYMGACDIENLRNEFPKIPGNHFFRYRCRNVLFRLGYEIPHILRHNSFDFAHFQYISPLFNRRACKYIVTTHDVLFMDFKQDFPWGYRFVRSPIFKYSCKHADIRTTPSAYSGRCISNHYRIPSEGIAIIPNGVGDEFSQTSIGEETASDNIVRHYNVRNFILYVSRLEPRKNHALLLKLFLDMQLYKKGIALVFIGRGSIREPALKKMMKVLPVDAKPYFRHFQHVNSKELLWFYRAAKLIVYPSSAEGFGIPPLEAAAMKTPVLCANTTAMSAFSFFGDDLFNPENMDEFREKLGKKLFADHNKGDLTRISDTIHQEYSWEKSSQKFLNLLKQSILF